MPFNDETKIFYKNRSLDNFIHWSLNTTTTKKIIIADKYTKRLKGNPLLTSTNIQWISFTLGQLRLDLSQTIF